MAGIDAKNKDSLDSKFICPVCLLLLRNPVQLGQCGHRQCQLCVDDQSTTTILCRQCGIETPQNQVLVDRGFKNDMQGIPIKCLSCQWTGILADYDEHLHMYNPNPKCRYCHKEFNSFDALDEHKVSEFEQSIIYCPLKNFGCNEPLICSKILEHFLSPQHQDTIMKAVRQKQAQLPDAQSSRNASQTTATTVGDPVTSTIQELYETLNILTGEIEALNDDTQRLSNESLQSQIRLQAVTEDFSRVKLSVEESHSFLQKVKHNQAILSQDVTSLKEKINDIPYVSDDETYVWKITNFKEKMNDARSEKQTSIYSPSFYTSPTGYKMRARLYLNGDGNARSTHLSLFFVLMRGMNDPILKFPFTYKVTFCLYDQAPAQRHVIDSFRPDIRSNSFQRTRSDMNIASGILKFLSIAMIQQDGTPYVKDDTMFLKIMVDFGDIPKTFLPYALSLNPGLPTNIQQWMIIQEAKRRAEALSQR